MSCLLCTNAVAMHFDRMFAHVKHVHGHTFGNPQTKEEIVKRIKELKAKRYETHPNHVVALQYCVESVGLTVVLNLTR